MKTLLLDIDYTILDGQTPRPYLKEFMVYVTSKYNVVFYTAGTHYRVTEALRVLIHKLGFEDPALIRKIQRKSLTRENCPMIHIPTGKCSTAEIKCFKKASEKLGVPVEDMIMLDDNPSYDNPHWSQIIQAEGFMADNENDDYLKRIIEQNIL